MAASDVGAGPDRRRRLLIFIVAFNAEKTVERVLTRIPEDLLGDERLDVEILIIDDASRDATFEVAERFRNRGHSIPITNLRNPANLGYGGNQKLGYRFAIDQGFDFVALIHGDGQYAPEELPRLLEPLLAGGCDALFGSRMMTPGAARRGGMPLYKYFGNKLLTWAQNRIVGTRLSEYHSGYRIYSTRALAAVPFEANADGFDFDTDIIIQLSFAGFRIHELPVPTFYGDEICHVNGVQYAAAIIWTSLLARLQRYGVLYDRRFDVVRQEADSSRYEEKFGFESSHSAALERVSAEDSVLLLGCGPRSIVEPFAARAARSTAVDLDLEEGVAEVCDRAVEGDLDTLDLTGVVGAGEVTKVLALDVIEHLRSPEDFLRRLRNVSGLQGVAHVFTTANVAFLPIRLMLLAGGFHYGKSGILDRTHTRLFTFSSFRRMLQQEGYSVEETRGIPAPFPLALGRESKLAFLLLRVNGLLARLWASAFAYQILVVARPLPTTDGLLGRAVAHSREVARALSPSTRPTDVAGS